MFFSSPAYAQTFMPPAASAIAHHVDVLYGFLLIVSFISCVLVIGGFVYFSIAYRRKDPTANGAWITHNNVAEFLWSFIPFLIFMLVFVWGWIVYTELRTMPKNALEIAVTGQQWSWSFTYKSGKTTSGEFYVPIDQDIRLVMSSKDVIHSFYIPAFRNKQDVVPGRYTAMWFRPDKLGDYQVFCAEYCGDAHSGMLAKLHVVSREQYETWLGNDEYKGLAPVEVGKKVYASRCMVCHNTTTEKKIGPGWAGIFGKDEALEGGKTVKVDENYIRESIVDPNAKIVKGFPPAMPSFAGQLNDQEIMGVIEYIKTLK
jgi:cytochrome c oxidase subunit II